MCDGLQVGEDFFLAGVFACPGGVLVEGVGVEVRPDCEMLLVVCGTMTRGSGRLAITATAWVLVVAPCATQPARLLEDNEVVAVVALDEVDRGAEA